MATASVATAKHAGDGPAGGISGWLALAASPSFALMAGLTAGEPSAAPLCSAGTGLLPVDGMLAMYLLMSLFHLPPWLNLASRRRRSCT